VNRTILAIDTSTDYAEVALELPDGQRSDKVTTEKHSHSSSLVKIIEELLSRERISFSELDAVVIGSGPGSFTGLRIGYAFAKGLSASLKVPLFSYSSFMAAASSAGEGVSVVFGDARREEVFLGVYRIVEGALAVILAPQISPVGELLEIADGKRFGQVNHFISGDTDICKKVDIIASLPKMAGGLIDIFSVEYHQSGDLIRGLYNPDNVIELAPNYIRSVAAKTIKERLEGSNK